MKKHARFSFALAAAFVLGSATLSAQTLFTPSGSVSTGSGGIGVNANPALAPLDVVGNNFLVRPSNSFNPNGKFIALGESGGTPGPINGCDLYGFRAQANDRSFINIGLKFEAFAEEPYNNVPTIAWGSFDDVKQTSYPKPLQVRYDLNVGASGCGNVVAQWSGIGYTYTVFGSALASGGSWVNSDARFKNDIQAILSPMDIINQLKGKTYTFDVENYPERNFNEGLQYGFIAQELQEVMPEAVKADETGYLGVNYDAVIPVIVEGMKEQQVTIEEQTAQLEEQQAVIENQELVIRQLQDDVQMLMAELRVDRKAVNGETSEATDETTPQLFQNRPNPFRETTEINFYLPTTVGQASLVVYDLSGREMMTFNNLGRGYNRVLVEGGQLEPGNYLYRLIADETVVSSKTLVLSR